MKIKKLLSKIGIVAILVSVFPFWAIADEPVNQILYAGKDTPVGEIAIDKDFEFFKVTYKLDEGYCLLETHLHIGDDTPKAGGKIQNPVPGQFEYSEEHDCVSSYTYNIPWDEVDLGETTVAAHAVVSNYPTGQMAGNIFGVRTTGGAKGIYELDMVNSTPNLLLGITGTTEDVDNGTGYTNALAYNPTNNTLYFTAPRAVNVTPSPLWKYIPGESDIEKVCDLEGSVVGASFYDGDYYYIVEGTRMLMKITDMSDGCEVESVCEFGTGSYTFGDFSISHEGILYGSTRATPQRFFSFDINDCEESYTEGGDSLDLQLAFGSNGVLYGTKHSTGQFYEVDTSTGDKIGLSLVSAGFADLASGKLFVPEIETAWAGNERFNEKGNWATYFTYEINPPLFLSLLEKNTSTDWSIKNDGIIGLLTFWYGEKFNFKVEGGLKESTGYTLINYGGYTNVKCLNSGTTDTDGSLEMNDIMPKLSELLKETSGEGAKIWLVLTSNVNCSTNKMVSWNPIQYLFEHETLK